MANVTECFPCPVIAATHAASALVAPATSRSCFTVAITCCVVQSRRFGTQVNAADGLVEDREGALLVGDQATPTISATTATTNAVLATVASVGLRAPLVATRPECPTTSASGGTERQFVATV